MTPAGPRKIHLPDRLRQVARARKLCKPTALVGVTRHLEAPHPFDYSRRLFRTKSFTA
jgi:hypothetical protein